LTEEPLARRFVNVLLGILIFTPPKGSLLRFMGGKRPNWSALAANSASELPSLGFPLSALGLAWPSLLAVSFGISTIIEWLALLAMGTGRVAATFIMALYINIFAHMVVAGYYLWRDDRLLGGAVYFASFLIFLVPIFVRIVPAPAGQESR
jgi:hypothetical protein